MNYQVLFVDWEGCETTGQPVIQKYCITLVLYNNNFV